MKNIFGTNLSGFSNKSLRICSSPSVFAGRYVIQHHQVNNYEAPILAGYTALNFHGIWPRLLWGEHILYIRAKMK